MKRAYILFILLAGGLLIQSSCTNLLCLYFGYNPRDVRESCKTPEAGTLVDPKCKLIVNIGLSKMAENDSIIPVDNFLLEILTPEIKWIKDTVIESAPFPLRVRLYCDQPVTRMKGLPVLLYYHGGGFIWGSIDIYDNLNRKLAKETGYLVIAPEYRLAPEFPFPCAVEDAYTALVWAAENAGRFGGDPDRIIVMGSSAGANLATVVSLKADDLGGPGIFGQILIYPVTTFEEIITPSRKHFFAPGSNLILDRQYADTVRSSYMGSYTNDRDPYLSPLRAYIHSNLPPAMVITAQCDPLRDEGRMYAHKLDSANILLDFREYEGMTHAFISFYPFLREGRIAIRSIREFVEEVENHTSTGTVVQK